MADINLGVGGANSAVAEGYDIANSLKVEPDNTEKIYRPSGVGTSVTSTQGTISYWHKGTELASGTTFHWVDGTASQNHYASLNGNDVFYIAGRNESVYKLLTTRVFRDTSAWYHFVIVYDTTQATASDRIKLYVNGVQETSFSTANYPAQNLDLRFLTVNGQTHIGNNAGTSSRAGYYSEVYFLDGQTLAPTDFGEFDEDTGIWKPIEFTGSFGSNDYYLDFESSGSLGADASGNSNNFSLQNVTSADQATDTPTNNFCTLNPLYKCADTTMTDGATNCDRTNNANNTVRGTFVVTKGKWYWEVAVYRGTVNANYPFMGMTGNFTTDACSWLYGDSKSFYVSGSGNVEDAGTFRGSGTAAAQDPNYSIYGFAVDIDNEELYWYTNGTVNNSGNAYSISTSVGNSDEGMTPFLFMFTGANQSFNFGGYSVITPSSAASDANGYGNFEYAPPTGYYALCTKNLAEFG